MKHLATILISLFISTVANAANKEYSDTINYKVPSGSLHESTSGNINYQIKYTKNSRIMNFTIADKNGIATLTDKSLYLNYIEIEWASTATESQILAIYNADLNGSLTNLYDENKRGEIWTKISCEGPNTKTKFVATDPCTEFGLKPSSKEAAISSIIICWSDEKPAATPQEPDVDNVDFTSDELSVERDQPLTGEFFENSHITLAIGESSSASISEDGLNLNGELIVNAIDGYIIKNIEVASGVVEILDDWSAIISSNNEDVTITDLSIRLGYEMPSTSSHNGVISVTEFPADIVVTHTGSDARIFYIFEETAAINNVSRQNVPRRLPEQNQENWTEVDNGKITIEKSGTLHCYAANADHSILSEIKSENVDINTGIDEITVAVESPAVYYSLQGVCLGSDFTKLSKGIYICRQSGTVTKVVKQ